jgi:hypothetical protein
LHKLLYKNTKNKINRSEKTIQTLDRIDIRTTTPTGKNPLSENITIASRTPIPLGANTAIYPITLDKE